MKSQKKIIASTLLASICLSNCFANGGFISETIDKSKEIYNKQDTQLNNPVEKIYPDSNKEKVKEPHLTSAKTEIETDPININTNNLTNNIHYSLSATSDFSSNHEATINASASKQLINNPNNFINPSIAISASIDASLYPEESGLNVNDFKVAAKLSNKMFDIFNIGVSTDLYTRSKERGLNTFSVFGSMDIPISDKLTLTPNYTRTYNTKDTSLNSLFDFSNKGVSNVVSADLTYNITDNLFVNADINYDIEQKSKNSGITIGAAF